MRPGKRNVRGGTDAQSCNETGCPAPPRQQRDGRRGTDDERDEPELRDALDLALQHSFPLAEALRSRDVVRRDAA